MNPPGPSSAAPASPIQCPRCAYDLSGQVRSWVDHCPVKGRCPECGLVIDWRDRLNPEYASASRLFEHARERHLAALVRTIGFAVRPWALFRELRLEHPIVWPRAIAVAATGSVVVYLITAAVRLGLFVGYTVISGSQYTSYLFGEFWRNTWREVLWPVREPDYTLTPGWPTAGWVMVGALAFLLMGGMCMASPFTLGGPRVRSHHLLRLTLYSVISLPLLVVFWADAAAPFYVVEVACSRLGWSNNWIIRLAHWISDHQLVVFSMLTATWVFLFWSLAAARYLRLAKPFRTTAALLALSLAASMALFLFLPPGVRHLFAHR